MPASSSAAPLVAHVVFRFDYGGLENGIVNLVNRMPADRYRHAIIALIFLLQPWHALGVLSGSHGPNTNYHLINGTGA